MILTPCYSGQFPQKSAQRGTQDTAPRAPNSACTRGLFSAATQKVRFSCAGALSAQQPGSQATYHLQTGRVHRSQQQSNQSGQPGAILWGQYQLCDFEHVILPCCSSVSTCCLILHTLPKMRSSSPEQNQGWGGHEVGWPLLCPGANLAIIFCRDISAATGLPVMA